MTPNASRALGVLTASPGQAGPCRGSGVPTRALASGRLGPPFGVLPAPAPLAPNLSLEGLALRSSAWAAAPARAVCDPPPLNPSLICAQRCAELLKAVAAAADLSGVVITSVGDDAPAERDVRSTGWSLLRGATDELLAVAGARRFAGGGAANEAVPFGLCGREAAPGSPVVASTS